MSKCKYWMIQGIRDTNFQYHLCCYYDIYPLKSIVDIWGYSIIHLNNIKNSMSMQCLDNFTLILSPSTDDNKLFRKNGNWYIWDYYKNSRFWGDYQEFLKYLEYRGGIKRSDILWAKRVIKKNN